MTEKIIRFFKAKETVGRHEAGDIAEHYRDLIRQNLGYIEAQCVKAVRIQLGKHHTLAGPDMELQIENEALELSSLVLDKLEADDFKILRQFQGKSKLTTYLTAIISRSAVDMLRQKYGRSRQKERARTLGPLGEKVYKIVFQQGLSLVEVQKDFLHRRLPVPTDKAIQEVIEKIGGPGKIPAEAPDIKTGYLRPADNPREKASVVVPDNSGSPEQTLEDQAKRQAVDDVLSELIDGLSGEDRMILRMRFGLGKQENPRKIPDIAAALNISPKTVYKRIDTILGKCRKHLAVKGVTIHDLF
jgi:RNA polymerase sigma factor (sigma-70 family)